MSDVWPQDFTPVGAPGVTAHTDVNNAWRAPGSGTPLSPDQAAHPSSDVIADQVARKFLVPHGPIRTATYIFGATGVPNNAGQQLSQTTASAPSGLLNSRITQVLLPGSGLIRSIDFQAQIVTTGAASGILQFYDQDITDPLLRNFVVNVGATGTYTMEYAAATLGVPFLNGIVGIWTPITAAFGVCMIAINIDFESIPIGQKMNLSPYPQGIGG